MTAISGSHLGLVELADYELLIDSLGSATADQIRVEFFNRLKQWVRSSDHSRAIDQHRNLVVLKGVDSPAALELATAKLHRLFEQPYDLFGDLTQIEIRAGFARMDGKTDIHTALQQARHALRQARNQSALYRVFDGRHRDPVISDHRTVKALENALAQGELQLYYQPKIQASFGSIMGAEALMRWHPLNSPVVHPGNFIGAAERSRIIRPLTWWAIKSAIGRMSRWPDNISVSINIPPHLLLDDEILDVIRDMLDLYSVRPSRVVLEVTENIMVENQQQMMTQLARLRKMGLKVSIDDFGTGHSSLTYFRNLPADELKIDKSFVTQMLKSQKDLAIVRAVIDLAHNFALKVVAEGVEDQTTADRLKELGCDYLQGYLFDRPLPVEEFEKRYIL